MNLKLLTTTALIAVLASPVLAHPKNEKHIECLVNEIYDAVNNVCLPVLNESNDGFVDTDTQVVENELDWPGNSDDHRQDKDRAQRTGNNGRGTGDALDGGNPPGKGNFRNDIN